jgi:predicted PurR-regulated permease PerM
MEVLTVALLFLNLIVLFFGVSRILDTLPYSLARQINHLDDERSESIDGGLRTLAAIDSQLQENRDQQDIIIKRLESILEKLEDTKETTSASLENLHEACDKARAAVEDMAINTP